MKKLLIPIAAIAIGTSAYLYQSQDKSYNVLNYVPADTPFFSGQLKPFPIKEYITSSPSLMTPADQEKLDILYSGDEPALHFFANLGVAYLDGLQDADALVKTFGLADNIRAYFYTLGLLPVLKIEVANPQAIWDLLDQNEQKTGFVHKEGKLQDLLYRAYPLTKPNDPIQLDLIIAQANGILTLTLNTQQVSKDLLAMALGLEEASDSLADSDMLANIIKQHNLSDQSLGFINHLEIVKGLTSTDGNQLAKQLAEIAKQNNYNPFEMLQTPICEREFTSVAQNWPRTVFGYTKIDISEKESTLGFASIIESKNKVILDSLKTLRGYIPNYTQEYKNNVVATSLGLDISKLASSLTSAWTEMQTPMYQCLPLAEAQAQIADAGQSIAMLGMSANVAAGVKGVSAAVFDYAISQVNDQPQLDSFDALIAIHADKPETIFNSIKMFVPQLQQLELTNNGPAISLNDFEPGLAELKLDPKLVLKGNHLIIYNGNKGQQEAEKLALEKLSSNGLYQVSFDAKKMFTPIVNAAEFAGEIIPEEAMFLVDYDARMNMKLDINDQGIRFDSTVNNKLPEKQ